MIFYSRSKYIRWMWCPFSSFRNRDGSFSYKQWRKTHGKSRIFSPTSNKMYTGILAWKVDFFPHLFHTHFSSFKKQCRKEFFQNLWKCRCNILVSFQSHLKKSQTKFGLIPASFTDRYKIFCCSSTASIFQLIINVWSFYSEI